MRWSQLTAVSALACFIGMAGCDKAEGEKHELEAAAAAALGEGKDDKARELNDKEAAERRLELERQKAKEAEENARFEAFTARFVKAPAKPSKSLVAACDALVLIYSDWVKAVYFDADGFQLDFFDNKKKNLGVVKANCAKLGSIPATDCIIEVIEGVSAEDVSEDDRKLIQSRPDYLFDQCAEQFAPETR